jgi:hypothetical protein
MFDQILDNYRKAAEATMQFQQQMLRNMTSHWTPMFGLGIPNPGAAWLEQVHAAQKKWAETVTDMLNKHRETLDAQYRAGIKTIEEAFKLGEAKDPEQFRRLTEELWRHSFDCLRNVVESQMKDVQAAVQKVYEAAAKTAPGARF